MLPADTIPAAQPFHRLRSARKLRGLNQAELAAQTGISPSVLSRIETAPGLPSSATLVRIADALDMSTDYLVGRADNPAMPDVTARLDRDIEKLSIANREIVRRLIASLLDAQASRRPRVQGGDHDPA